MRQYLLRECSRYLGLVCVVHYHTIAVGVHTAICCCYVAVLSEFQRCGNMYIFFIQGGLFADCSVMFSILHIFFQ